MLPYENQQGGADNLDRKKLNYMLPNRGEQIIQTKKVKLYAPL